MNAAETYIHARLKDSDLTEGQRGLLHLQLHMIHNPLTCDECNRPAEHKPGGRNLCLITDFRGNRFALICSECRPEVDKMLNVLFHKYGGYIDEQGTTQASCHGSPNIQSLEHLRKEVS